MKRLLLLFSIVAGMLYSAPGYSSPEEPPTPTHGSREQDSLALVALYRKTDGDNWIHKHGWLTNEPIDKWSGVTVFKGRVTKIELRKNQLTGRIPGEIGNLGSLMELDLGNSHRFIIEPRLGQSSALCNACNLKEFDLIENQLSGEIPPEISYLRKLRELDLLGNQLSGEIPPGISYLRELRELDLSENRLSGELPKEIQNLSKLERLDLSENQLSGELPKEIQNLSKLEKLNLFKNQLSGGIPKGFGNLSTLIYLDLSQNCLSGGIPKGFGNLSTLMYLDLSQNSFSGGIPKEFGKLRTLIYLDLSQNSFSGGIPKEFGKLKKLAGCGLSDNELSGEIPKEFGNLKKLGWLYLSDNALSGKIPKEIGNMSRLQSLDLSGNELSGGVPSEIGNLRDLSELNLSKNAFSGGIPKEFRNLSLLSIFNIENCKFDSGLENLRRYSTSYYHWYNPMLTSLASNRFDFSDLSLAPSQLTSDTNIRYSPQDSVGVQKHISVPPGGSLEYPLEMPDTEGNVYLWYKDGEALEDQTSRILSIKEVTTNDGGRYECRITNARFPKLTLYSRNMSVRVGR